MDSGRLRLEQSEQAGGQTAGNCELSMNQSRRGRRTIGGDAGRPHLSEPPAGILLRRCRLLPSALRRLQRQLRPRDGHFRLINLPIHPINNASKITQKQRTSGSIHWNTMSAM